MLDTDGENGLLDLTQTSRLEELGQVALVGARKLGFVRHVRIELARRLPEQSERPAAAGVIPNACGHDTTRARYSRHLAKPGYRVGHKVNNELSESCIKCLILKRQLLGTATARVDAGVTHLHCCDKGFGRINGGHGRRPEPAHQLGGQGARTAAHIHHSLTSHHSCEIREPRSKGNRIPAHEPVISVCPNCESHAKNLIASAIARATLREVSVVGRADSGTCPVLVRSARLNGDHTSPDGRRMNRRAAICRLSRAISFARPTAPNRSIS